MIKPIHRLRRIDCWRAIGLPITVLLMGSRAAVADVPAVAWERIETPLPLFDGDVVRSPRPDETLSPVELWLSRDRYWSADGHLDGVVRLHAPDQTLSNTRLEGRVAGANGETLAEFDFSPPPAAQLAFYPMLPTGWLGTGEVELVWQAGGEELGRASAAFRVDPLDPPPPAKGRVPLRIANAAGVSIRGLPQSVGVPFPRGALWDAAHLRLVDEQGTEVPLQVMETARWSKYGSIRWVLCDFTVDLDGEPRKLLLEYGSREETQLAVSAVVGRFSSEAGTGAGDRVAAGRPIREIEPAGRSQSGATAAPPAVDGRRRQSMSVDSGHGAFPAIDAERLRFGPDGLAFDPAGDGTFVSVLSADALSGAFVEHEDGRVYRPDPDTPFEIEEAGPEKVVIRRQGWYVAETAAVGRFSSEAGTGADVAIGGQRPIREIGPTADPSDGVPSPDARRSTLDPRGNTASDARHASPTPTPRHPPLDSRFCQYVTRFVIHRDSPIVRVFHTWIFTGDGNRDRIRSMGWRFPLSEGGAPAGVLAAFDDPEWLEVDSLVQYDFDRYLLHRGDERIDVPGGRAPGVARLKAPLGDPPLQPGEPVTDRPPQQGVRLYFGAKDFWQAYPSELEFRDNAFWFHNWPRHGLPHPEPRVEVETAQLLKFAHTGEVLDLRLPHAFTIDPLDRSHHRDLAGSRAWKTDEPESVNAQGVARTEEFWLFLTPETVSDADARQVLQGLNDETLRAGVDPQWMSDSGVFHEIGAADPNRFPDAEANFLNSAIATGERGHRMDIFGMWLHGERAWNNLSHANLYRGLLKAHRGFPYSWVPYARSGDARLLKFAQTDNRRATDANFCNYVGPAVALTGTGWHEFERSMGNWTLTPLPWGGRGPWQASVTGLQAKRAHLWHAWYLTGYHRARDMAAVMDGLIRAWPGDHSARGGRRGNEVQLKNALYSWKDGGDPWFLVRAHLIARQQREAWATDRMQAYGSFWTMGDADYHRYTGNEAHGDYLLEHIRARAGTRVGPLAYGWRISGDDNLLRIIVGTLDGAAMGSANRQGSNYLQHYPLGIGALGAVAQPPLGIYPAFWQRLHDYTERDDGLYVFRTPTVRFRKTAGESLPLFLGLIRLQTYRVEDDDRTWWIDGPDGREFMTGDMSGIGTFDNRPGREVVIPAEAPPGVYRLRFEFRSPHDNSMRGSRQLRGIRFPITPPGTPEVIELEAPRMGPTSFGATRRQPRYFFHVPKTVERFAVERISTAEGPVALINPAGRTVWEAESPARVDVELDVPEADRGGLWSIIGAQFEMDPQIPPYFAIDPDRWFDPQTQKE